VKRLEARRAVQDFFWEKREALDRVPDKQIRKLFLAEMNSIARDLEVKAMALAERGEDWKGVLEEARQEFEKLKQEYLKRLGGKDPVDAPNLETVRAIESL